MVSNLTLDLFKEIEFSFIALLASPLDFKKPDFSTRASIIGIPLKISSLLISVLGTPSKISKKDP